MSSIPKLEISPDFTIKDIHKIREWNYERRKGMSPQEIIDDIKAGAREFEVLIEKARQSMDETVIHEPTTQELKVEAL